MNNVLLDTHGKVWTDNGEQARLRVLQDAWGEAVTKPCRVAKWWSRDKSLLCTND
jgi:hypothetical protein